MQSDPKPLARIGIYRLFMFACLVVLSGTARAAVVLAAQSGDWNTPSTWIGTVPGSTDYAIIPVGITVTINNHNSAILNFNNSISIEVFGSLVLAGNDDINFVTPVIIHVFSGGTMTDNTIRASYYFEPGSFLVVYNGATYSLGTIPVSKNFHASEIYFTNDPTGYSIRNPYSLVPQSGPFTIEAYPGLLGQIFYNNSLDNIAPKGPHFDSNPVNYVACSSGGGPTATFSVVAMDLPYPPYLYIWQVSVDGGSTWSFISTTANYSNPDRDTLTITNATTSFNNYRYRCVIFNNSSGAASKAAVLTFASPGQWLGANSNSWSNAANWGCRIVPGPTTNATINAGLPNMPVIDGINDGCDSLVINTGAALSFTGTGNELTINGTLTNSGSFSTALGTIVLAGSGQPVPALRTYNNLQISGSGNHLVNTPLTVNGALTLTNGTLDLGSNDLTIAPTASIAGGSAASYVITDGTGALLQQNIGTGGITGTVNFPIGTTTSYTPLSLLNTGTADIYGARVIPDIYSVYTAADMPSGTPQTAKNVNNTWLVTEGVAGGSNVTLGFQWNGTDEQTSFNRNACFASHYTGGAWVPGPLNQTAAGSGPYSISLSGINSFSPFGVGSPGKTVTLTAGPDAYHVFPNPVKGAWLYVQATEDNPSQKDVLASVIDISGHILLKTLIKAQNLQTGQVTLDISTIPPGFYILQLNEGNGVMKKSYKFSRM